MNHSRILTLTAYLVGVLSFLGLAANNSYEYDLYTQFYSFEVEAPTSTSADS